MRAKIISITEPDRTYFKDDVKEITKNVFGNPLIVYNDGRTLHLEKTLFRIEEVKEDEVANAAGYKAAIQKQLEARVMARNYPDLDTISYYQVPNQAGGLEYHAIVKQTSNDFGRTVVSIKHFVHCDDRYSCGTVPELESLEYSSYRILPEEFELLK